MVSRPDDATNAIFNEAVKNLNDGYGVSLFDFDPSTKMPVH